MTKPKAIQPARGLFFCFSKEMVHARSFVFCQLEMMMESNFKKRKPRTRDFPAHFLSRKFHVAAP
jgi:hypothetical protein